MANVEQQPTTQLQTKKEGALVGTLIIVVVAVALLALIGFLFLKPKSEIIEGQAEATSVRISGKLPGRVLEFYVQEGQDVKAGDTLVHIHSSLAEAKLYQAEAIAMTTLVSAGVDGELVNNLLQPVVTQEHPIGNPWLNYSIYLSNSFLPCLLQLIIFQITAFSILQEIKLGTSIKWVNDAGQSIVIALFGKLMPQFIIFTSVGLAMQSLIYFYWGFPLNGNVWSMIWAMVLLVIASQAFALMITSLIPNLRFALSILSLVGILSFSIAAFSFPVESMYPAVGIFSYIVPIRYYFLIYINVALNGYEVYYCRWDYIVLILFALAPMGLLWKLKKNSLNPVYVP